VRLEAYGIRVDLPEGWDGRISRRPGGDPTLHAGNFPLPAEDGEFGSGALATMGPGGVFLTLTEYDPAGAGRGLFASNGAPRSLRPGDLDPNALQRRIRGQAGAQRFFTEADRTWCLYVVAGSVPSRSTLVEKANTVLGSVRIAPWRPPAGEGPGP